MHSCPLQAIWFQNGILLVCLWQRRRTFVAKCWNRSSSRELTELSSLTIESATSLCLRINIKLESLHCGFCTFSWNMCPYYRSVSSFFKGEVVLQESLFSKSKCFPTMILFLYKDSREKLSWTPRCLSAAEAQPWCLAGTHLAVLLEENTVSSVWGQRPFPVHPAANELLLAQAASKAPGGSSCLRAPFCALGERKECATTALLPRLGQAFDLCWRCLTTLGNS